MIRKLKDGLKILGAGELKRKITVKAHVFSKSALEKIQAAGGTAEVIGGVKLNARSPRPVVHQGCGPQAGSSKKDAETPQADAPEAMP